MPGPAFVPFHALSVTVAQAKEITSPIIPALGGLPVKLDCSPEVATNTFAVVIVNAK
jgi:hypothetical protein